MAYQERSRRISIFVISKKLKHKTSTGVRNQVLQKGLRFSCVLLLFLNACGQPPSSPMPQAHKTDSAGPKATVMKKRQACMSQVQDGTKSDKAGVSICTYHPKTNTYESVRSARQFSVSHGTDNAGNTNSTITMNVGVGFYPEAGTTSSLTTDQKNKILSEIAIDCEANTKYFWSQANITLNVKYFNPETNTDTSLTADQNLALDYTPINLSAKDAKNSDDTTNYGDVELKIEDWNHGHENSFDTTVADCNVAAANSADNPAKAASARLKCRTLSNQKFCLALNKMVGLWLGAKDTNDLNCVSGDPSGTTNSTPASTSPVATATDKATASSTQPPKPSFMTFPVNPVPATPVKVAAADTAPDLADPVVTTQTAADLVRQAQDYDERMSSNNQNDQGGQSAGNDQTIVAAAAAVNSADNSDSADIVPRPPVKPGSSTTTPTPTKPTAPKDQSSDPSYIGNWQGFDVSFDDTINIFGCDPNKLNPQKNNAKNPSQANNAKARSKIAVPVATQKVNNQKTIAPK